MTGLRDILFTVDIDIVVINKPWNRDVRFDTFKKLNHHSKEKFNYNLA